MAPTPKNTDPQATPSGKEPRAGSEPRRTAPSSARSAAAAGRAGPERRLGRGSEAGGGIEVSSTEAQNNFGLLLDRVARDEPVFIRRRQRRQAVIISVERYEALTRAQESPLLDGLTDEFDALFERMQGAGARRAVDGLFTATPDELGRAAVKAARHDPR
jgi:antitoxin Phd